MVLVGNPIDKQERLMSKISLKVVGFKEEMARVEREVKRLANNDIESRIDLADQTLKQVTPVDTGEARRGWRTRKFRDANDGLIDAVIENKVKHISYLNNGHSKQAPKYFIEQVLMKIGLITPR